MNGDTVRTIGGELSDVDHALYAAVANTPTPNLDEGLRALSRAANKSVLWLTIAGGMAALGGSRGRRAALTGVASIAAASLLVNAGVKFVARRDRPDRPVGNAHDRWTARCRSGRDPDHRSGPDR